MEETGKINISGTTDECFRKLVEDPELWKRTGGSASNRRQFLFFLKNQKGITLDTKQKWLIAAGFVVKQQETWRVPPKPTKKQLVERNITAG